MRIGILFLFVLFACAPAQKPDADQWVKDTFSQLTLEQKVAQLVCVDISGQYIAADDPKLLRWINLAHDVGIGGFVCYGGTPHSVASLLNRLQGEAKIPILISTDFEGGPGQQIAGASEFPSNMGFAATGEPMLMFMAAEVMAKEGRAMGFHLSYTPVTDISISPANPQESGRSFGGNMIVLGEMLKLYVSGFHQGGMLTTSKHFPGRGDMKGGPAYPSFTKLDKDAAALDSLEFRAFKLAIDAGVDFMMTEHIAVPAITGNDLPASVEPKLAKGIIRDKLGFKGILTSDDLWYDHVTARFGKEEVAVKAMEAGHDIVLKPKDPVATIAAIVEAVKQGRISREHIDQAVLKLLTKKAQLGLHINRMVNMDSIPYKVGIELHKQLVQRVADQSVTMVINKNGFPVQNLDPATAVHIVIQRDEEQPNAGILIREITAAFPGMRNFTLRPERSKSYTDEVRRAALGASHVILSFLVQRNRHGDPAPVRPEDAALLNEIILKKPGKVVAMSFGNPHLLQRIPKVSAFFVGYGEGGFYGNQTVYFSSWIRLLKGELDPKGVLPIAIVKGND